MLLQQHWAARYLRVQYLSTEEAKIKGKKHKAANMIPPSRPNVTRLSDDSVMLRWYVPKNNGLPIQFFKVQYRMLGDSSKNIPRDIWQTTNEDIPYGKHDRKNEGANFTSSVTGLKPDLNYKFRIIAVYSNNDNKEGNTSARFFLQRASELEPSVASLPVPELVGMESLSESAIMLHWTLPASPENMADGFYAYYRPASSAGEYQKTFVDGMHTRKFIIGKLEPGTIYEFKLQSYNTLAASEFSAIVQAKTKNIPTTPPPNDRAENIPKKTNHEANSLYPVVAGAAGGGLLLLLATVATCLCMRRRKSTRSEDDDKPQLDHIQADFVTPSVLGVSSHHKSGHRLNGVIPRMNITANPLAQESDKNHLASHQNGLHHAQPYHPSAPGTPTLIHKRDYQHPPPVPPHQNNNHHQINNMIPPQFHHQAHHQLHQNMHHAYQTPTPPPMTPRSMDRSIHYSLTDNGDASRIPSLRRTRRSSGHAANNNGGVGIPIVPGSPRVQRSPMPRTTLMKQQRNRLGSHNDNISSGSLNSIEV